ncbi:hypothetical protein ABL78_8276 [Leptomonas seymouri]|uniref:Uncharacterized protein n=1 Tax=Leptomonas seymouri TaxID=5684 RepID=A0A0N1IG68_LEPSE|nr:hypothetical protein ABL78_8276 [Leptomonas seymouri]|eukprot:KPI82711.1 hypothetical protein ABL78_8276 [Leptomonas seymouri]
MHHTYFALQLVVCPATLQVNDLEAYLPGSRHISVGVRPSPVENVYAACDDNVKPEPQYIREMVDAVISILSEHRAMPKMDATLDISRGHTLALPPAAVEVEAACSLPTKCPVAHDGAAPDSKYATGESRKQFDASPCLAGMRTQRLQPRNLTGERPVASNRH